MTERQKQHATRILETLGKAALGATTIAGGPTAVAVGVVASIAGPLVETLALIGRGEEPTDEQMARDDALCEASNANMHTAVDARLKQLAAG